MPRFFGQADGIRFKQAVRLELCGVALRLDSTAECYADKVMLSDSEKSLTFARFQ
ncbi:MAG: hypothetical protein UIH27_09795 [Ruminococcus sp.]|nr:hypothetical protein [Ruminococcus sp.]